LNAVWGCAWIGRSGRQLIRHFTLKAGRASDTGSIAAEVANQARSAKQGVDLANSLIVTGLIVTRRVLTRLTLTRRIMS
jgi:hypothetical protein